MSDLSAALSHDPARSDNAIQWAKQSIAVADKSVAEAPALEADDAATCLQCAGISTVNLGTLYAVTELALSAGLTPADERQGQRCARGV